jgi:hypothetical protein
MKNINLGRGVFVADGWSLEVHKGNGAGPSRCRAFGPRNPSRDSFTMCDDRPAAIVAFYFKH